MLRGRAKGGGGGGGRESVEEETVEELGSTRGNRNIAV